MIQYRATDSSGNAATGTQTITVRSATADRTPPSITAPADVTAEATAVLTAVDTGRPVVSDNADPSPSVSGDASAKFPLGRTVVTWTATDSAGNRATATQTVTVRDTTAPAIAEYDDITAEATGTVSTLDFPPPKATDIFAVTVSCDPLPWADFRVGTTAVKCTATDASGNAASVSFDVTVTPTNRTMDHTSTPLQWGRNATSTVTGSNLAPDSEHRLHFEIYPLYDFHLDDPDDPRYDPSYDPYSTDPGKNDNVYMIVPLRTNGTGGFSESIGYTVPNNFGLCQDRLDLWLFGPDGKLVYQTHYRISVKCSK